MSKFKKETEENIKIFKEIIDKICEAKSGGDLKKCLDIVYKVNWRDGTRFTFLIGLMQGALMQFKKDVSIKELFNNFKI